MSTARRKKKISNPLFAGTVSLLRSQDRLVFLGDFNPPHTSWGHARDAAKGNLLETATANHGLQLTTLPIAPRLGNSASVDTFPDLTFTLNLRDATWTNLDETLGSDHYFISVSSPRVRRTTGQVTIIYCFRYRTLPCGTHGPITYAMRMVPFQNA